jgi:uracil-DNA glycosylase
VLLLNACLTVRQHQANSHAGHGWETFTTEVLRAVSKATRGVVFLAWGTPAQKRVDSLGLDKSKHLVLRSVHPSPLSASRGFFECKHFVKTNEWLRNRYGVEGEVEWDCLAEGKQGRGFGTNGSLPTAALNGKQRAHVQQTEVVTDGKPGPALKSLSESTVTDKDHESTGEDAYEIDEEELASIP